MTAPQNKLQTKHVNKIEAKFCDAMHWEESTGEGVKEDEENVCFEELMTQRCPYYFGIPHVFQERAGMKTKITSVDLGNKPTEEGFGAFDENASISPGGSFENENKADNSGKTMTMSEEYLI